MTVARRKAVARTNSAVFGWASFTASRFFFTTSISFTSLCSPFGQELPLITRSHPAASGTLLQGRPLLSGRPTLMNVRLQSTGHHLHVVCCLVVLVYLRGCM